MKTVTVLEAQEVDRRVIIGEIVMLAVLTVVTFVLGLYIISKEDE